MITCNLIVLRAQDPKALAEFYERLGLVFEEDKHGKGPVHYAARLPGLVFEIYPRASEAESTRAVRLGLTVPSLERALADLPGSVVSPPKQTEWGLRAVIKDPEGHKVELLEISR